MDIFWSNNYIESLSVLEQLFSSIRSSLSICWINKERKDGLVTWNGKQKGSIISLWAAKEWAEICLEQFILQWICALDTWEITPEHCWWKYFLALLLKWAMVWTFHQRCFEMQKTSSIKPYQSNPSDICVLWSLADLS